MWTSTFTMKYQLIVVQKLATFLIHGKAIIFNTLDAMSVKMADEEISQYALSVKTTGKIF